jgi:hypothetical protein
MPDQANRAAAADEQIHILPSFESTTGNYVGGCGSQFWTTQEQACNKTR